MGYDLFKKDSIISIPFLNITYRNDCNANYYFFKTSPINDGIPNVLCTWLDFVGNEILKRPTAEECYTDQNFNVILGRAQIYEGTWLMYSDTFDYYSNYLPTEVMPCFVHLIYNLNF